MSKKSDYDIGPMPHDWQTDLSFGHKGEKLVSEFLEKISSGAFEVKTDRYRNGRMVVEMVQNPRRRLDDNGGSIMATIRFSGDKSRMVGVRVRLRRCVRHRVCAKTETLFESKQRQIQSKSVP